MLTQSETLESQKPWAPTRKDLRPKPSNPTLPDVALKDPVRVVGCLQLRVLEREGCDFRVVIHKGIDWLIANVDA